MINVYSIISKTHLANLQTVAESFNKYHSEVMYHVLLIDDIDGYCDLNELKGFKFYYPENICSASDLQELYVKYDAFHLACIFKAKFALFLFNNEKLKSLIYMDTDLYFCGAITNFLAELKNCNALFTPHLCHADMDQKLTKANLAQEAYVNATGIYNLGFFGINNTEESKKFLLWWYMRTKTFCHRDLRAGFFDDQKWLDPVHVFFEKISAFKNQSYNVAVWNLVERDVTKKNGRYFVNDDPLVFFHFSQINPAQDLFLTNHSPAKLKDFPAVHSLFQDYRKHLLTNKWERYNGLSFVKTIEMKLT